MSLFGGGAGGGGFGQPAAGGGGFGGGGGLFGGAAPAAGGGGMFGGAGIGQAAAGGLPNNPNQNTHGDFNLTNADPSSGTVPTDSISSVACGHWASPHVSSASSHPASR